MNNSMFPRYTEQGATFDEPHRKYRYKLWRRWSDGPLLLWIMLNPSTADEHVLDQTLKKVEYFSRVNGYAGFIVCNLFAWRATDPNDLAEVHHAYSDVPVGIVGATCAVGESEGVANDLAIMAAAAEVDAIVVGWGTEPIAQARARVVLEMLRGITEVRLLCLGTNKNGSPKHPLYLAKATKLVEFPPAA